MKREAQYKWQNLFLLENVILKLNTDVEDKNENQRAKSSLMSFVLAVRDKSSNTGSFEPS
jgi:hypothetical protein